MAQSDIQKWFMKPHDKGNGNASKPGKPTMERPSPATSQPEKKPVHESQESSGRRKTSKYFATDTIIQEMNKRWKQLQPKERYKRIERTYLHTKGKRKSLRVVFTVWLVLTFVISGTLDSLEREEAEDLIKRHGGRVTGSISKKTLMKILEAGNLQKPKNLVLVFLTEDGLFDMIRSSKPAKATAQEESKKKAAIKPVVSPLKGSPQKEVKDKVGNSSARKVAPKVPSIVKQLHDWLANWNINFSCSGQRGKGKKQNDSGSKKAVLLSGTPGIGKTTSAKLVSQMLGFQTIEVNASDNRGKADSKIFKGVDGSTANSIKELVSNEALSVKSNWSKHVKTVLIMDEVDGMSAGDRGGVADLIASIKISKITIICICNDRYSQKLKSLVNYCLLLSFRKPTKQQMVKRFLQVANQEGLQVNEIALEELAERELMEICVWH
ncbi:hypothetical protein NE237_026106 [Protea cynaroides]|uniref:BRCT domain-containing protein n=1 Tax=Protea cynaroides TaxID=273540 RepID=A0A9Q0H4A9_9MAGN|nr:hypothetical protein NE237_026106 [Protea cynaroides]